MAAFAFLSDEWIEHARELQAEYAGRAGAPPVQMRMNLVVTAMPFGEATTDAHLDTSSGELVLDAGHIESPDVTVTLDYETAKAILVEQNQQAGMQAFMSGRIKIDGDMSKLLALQSVQPDAVHAEIAQRVREMTL
ncbi:MAG: SCP2 sterol-binding domain-containing protein [Acidimicrobiales bacterium]